MNGGSWNRVLNLSNAELGGDPGPTKRRLAIKVWMIKSDFGTVPPEGGQLIVRECKSKQWPAVVSRQEERVTWPIAKKKKSGVTCSTKA